MDATIATGARPTRTARTIRDIIRANVAKAPKPPMSNTIIPFITDPRMFNRPAWTFANCAALLPRLSNSRAKLVVSFPPRLADRSWLPRATNISSKAWKTASNWLQLRMKSAMSVKRTMSQIESPTAIGRVWVAMLIKTTMISRDDRSCAVDANDAASAIYSD